MIDTKERTDRWVPTKPSGWRAQRIMRCGWCKGFIHDEWIGDMLRYVHDERPRTEHEVLPYRSE